MAAFNMVGPQSMVVVTPVLDSVVHGQDTTLPKVPASAPVERSVIATPRIASRVAVYPPEVLLQSTCPCCARKSTVTRLLGPTIVNGNVTAVNGPRASPTLCSTAESLTKPPLSRTTSVFGLAPGGPWTP